MAIPLREQLLKFQREEPNNIINVRYPVVDKNMNYNGIIPLLNSINLSESLKSFLRTSYLSNDKEIEVNMLLEVLRSGKDGGYSIVTASFKEENGKLALDKTKSLLLKYDCTGNFFATDEINEMLMYCIASIPSKILI